MSSSSEKGNISPFLLILAVIATISLFVSIAELMIFRSIKSGKYKNPNVATKVVEGNIYDTNGKILSMQVPVYNLYFDLARLNSSNLDEACQIASIYTEFKPAEIRQLCAKSKSSYIRIASEIDRNMVDSLESDIHALNLETGVFLTKSYKRIYPSQFHAAQLIRETENNLVELISPKPGLNTSTTYGNNIYLSLDMDVQYLLDLACSDIYESSECTSVAGCIINSENGYVVACTTYPYFDLNDYPADTDIQNKALPSSLEGVTTRVIEKVTDYESNTINDGMNYTAEQLGFTVDFISETCSVTSPMPALERPKYYIRITADFTEESDIRYLDNAVTSIEAGLRAQSKLN